MSSVHNENTAQDSRYARPTMLGQVRPAVYPRDRPACQQLLQLKDPGSLVHRLNIDAGLHHQDRSPSMGWTSMSRKSSNNKTVLLSQVYAEACLLTSGGMLISCPCSTPRKTCQMGVWPPELQGSSPESWGVYYPGIGVHPKLGPGQFNLSSSSDRSPRDCPS